MGVLAKRSARSRVRRQRLKPTLQCGTMSGWVRIGPGQVSRHGATVKYWFAKGSNIDGFGTGDGVVLEL